MTNPPPVSQDTTATLIEIRQGMSGLKETVAKLERAIQGDKDVGMPSMRESLKSLTDDLKSETEALNDRVEKLEISAMQTASYQNGMMTVIRWLGGSSLVALIGLIGALFKLFGGK